MILRDVVQALGLHVMAGERVLDREITGGYAADLLSCAMGRAKSGNLWLTLQAHPNVVAVASLLELSGVIVTEGASISEEVIAQANAQNVPLLSTPHTTFWVAGELARLGVRAQE